MNRASKKKLHHSHTQDCESVEENSEEHKLEETPLAMKEESMSQKKRRKNKLKVSQSKKREQEYMRTSHNVKNKQESILKNSMTGMHLRTSHDDRMYSKQKTSFADDLDDNSMQMPTM